MCSDRAWQQQELHPGEGTRTAGQCNGAHQVRVVLLVVLPELGGNWHNNWAIGCNCQDFVPKRLSQSQKVADLMLC